MLYLDKALLGLPVAYQSRAKRPRDRAREKKGCRDLGT